MDNYILRIILCNILKNIKWFIEYQALQILSHTCYECFVAARVFFAYSTNIRIIVHTYKCIYLLFYKGAFIYVHR